MAKKKRHHKAGRETSQLLSTDPSADRLFDVMLGPLYRWHQRGHRDYEAHIEELLKGFRLAPEVRRVYDAAVIKACADAFRNGHFKEEKDVIPLEVPAEEKAFDPYDVCTAMDVEIQLELTAMADRRLAEAKSVTVTMGDARTIAEKIERLILHHHPDLTSVFTGELLLARVVNVANAYSLFVRMLAAAGATGKDGYEIMPGVVQDFWEAKEGAGKEMAKDFPPDAWHAGVTKAIEYILRESAVDIARRKKTAGAAEVEMKLDHALQRLDARGAITPHIDRRFVASVAAAVVEIRRLGGLAGDTKRATEPEVAPVDEVTYHIPANYWPWKKLKLLIASAHAVSAGDEQIGGSAQAAITLFHECGQNFYLVGKQFLDELEETKMSLEGLKIMEEAPLPYKAFLLLFPLGYLKVHVVDGTEQEVVALHVSVTDAGPGTASGLWFGCVYEDGAVNRMFSTSIGFREDGTLIDTVDELYTQHEDNTHIPPGIQERLIQSTLHLGSLMTKVLAAMAAAPRIVETDTIESVRKAKKGRPKLSFKTPKVIGWKIRYIKRADRPRHASNGGPVAPHWRCKHLRRVPYGPTSVPLEDRPRRVVEIPEVRVNSEYEEPTTC